MRRSTHICKENMPRAQIETNGGADPHKNTQAGTEMHKYTEQWQTAQTRLQTNSLAEQATHCPGLLPCPHTTPGGPFLRAM